MAVSGPPTSRPRGAPSHAGTPTEGRRTRSPKPGTSIEVTRRRRVSQRVGASGAEGTRDQVADILGALAREVCLKTQNPSASAHKELSWLKTIIVNWLPGRQRISARSPDLYRSGPRTAGGSRGESRDECAGSDRPCPSTDRPAGQSGHLNGTDSLRFPDELGLLGPPETDVRLGIQEQLVSGKLQADRDDERRFVEADLGLERVVRDPCATDRRRLLGKWAIRHPSPSPEAAVPAPDLVFLTRH